MSSFSQIGQYRIEAHLGTGEWTETYHAYDIVLRRPVALKLLQPGILPAGKNYQDFLAAAQLASELVHPRIAWVWNTGELENRYFIVERFVGGLSLVSQLSQNGPLPWDQALRTIEQVAQAIEFAEERQWVHGRVTPHNILLSADHGAVLSDYGLVNAIRQILPRSAITLYDAQYLAPEVLQKQPVTARADQYALASTLVEMLSGKNPFTAPTIEETLLLKTTEIVRPLMPFEIMPVQAVEIIERALHADPTARYANSLDFVSALDRAIRAGLSDTAARRQHEETLQRWREAEESSRRETEEAARQEALDQARQEIHERARLEAEQVISQQGNETPGGGFQDAALPVIEPSSSALQPVPDTQEASTAFARLERAHRPARQRANRWPLVIFFIIILLGLVGYWFLSGQSTLLAPTASPTFTISPQPALQVTSHSPSPSLSPTGQNATATSTFTRSPTRPPTHTPSQTPSRTLAPSPTDTPIPPSLTPTRVRPEKEDLLRGG